MRRPSVPFALELTIVLLLVGAVAVVTLRSLLDPRKARGALIGIGVTGFSAALAVVAGEAVVRHAFRDVTTTGDNTSFFSRRWTTANPSIRNRYGFRERDFPELPPPGTYRIAVIGDSFTYGQGIAVEDRMTELLAARIESLASDFEVLNFGRPGAETIDHVEILRDVVLALQPNFVLLQWFCNDVEGHDKGSRPRPWRLVPSDTASNWLHEHSALYHLILSQWQGLQKRMGMVESYTDYLVDRFGDPQSAPARAAERALEGFLTLARERDVPMGIVIFPTLVEADGVVERYPMSFLIERVLEACIRFEIRCVDLRREFAAVSPAKKLWANRLDSHPGPLANRIAADAVFRAFAGHWLADRRPTLLSPP